MLFGREDATCWLAWLIQPWAGETTNRKSWNTRTDSAIAANRAANRCRFRSPGAATTFGTHAPLFGVNPWRLQAWLGHKWIDETMIYVHVAEPHHRELPEIVREKARGIDDPDQRVLAMLGARGSVELTEVRGSGVSVATASSEGTAAIIAA